MTKLYKYPKIAINMGTTLLQIKVLPESPETDLESIKQAGQEKIKEQNGQIVQYDEEPVAFGLKALIATLAWPEEKDTEIVEKIFKEIQGVSAVDIIDYRRAVG